MRLPPRIANEVELYDVLYRQARGREPSRSFTSAEVLAAFDRIDHALAAEAFTSDELAGIAPVAADDGRLVALADALQMALPVVA